MKALALLVISVAAATAQSDSSPAVVDKSKPQYTRQAIEAGVEGTVLLYAEIGTDGRAHRIRVIKGLGFGLDAKARESLRNWLFLPGTRDGIPVATPATIEVDFTLPGTAALPAPQQIKSRAARLYQESCLP